MDFIQCLTGPELEQLYLQDKNHDYFQEPENIKSLLTHILEKDIGELTNSDFEIIDFCNARIHPEGFPDKKKLQFMYDKYDLIRREKDKKAFYGNVRKAAACFAFILIGAITAFGLSVTEAEAGIFDWVRSLFIEEEEEQLIIRTANGAMPSDLREIEMKEGHLPEKMPKGYEFEKSHLTTSSMLSVYQYFFVDANNSLLAFNVTELNNLTTLHQHELELSKSSLKTRKKKQTIYYYAMNNNKYQISWITGLNIYSLTNDHSFQELEKIISYY